MLTEYVTMGEGQNELLRLSLDIWHPDCWTLNVTEQTDGKLLGRGTYITSEDTAKGRFTVFGTTVDEIDALIEEARDSPLTHSVLELHDGFSLDYQMSPGNTTREIFVEYDPEHSIDRALAENGFIRELPNRMMDGRELWEVVIHADRPEVQQRLDNVREAREAEITVRHITSSHWYDPDTEQTDLLSERQREIFEIACQRNYYTWPREISAKELASDLNITKTTLLEHLRKAEAKILNRYYTTYSDGQLPSRVSPGSGEEKGPTM